MDGVQAVLLGAGGQLELALGGAELAVHPPGQILLGAKRLRRSVPFGRAASMLKLPLFLFPLCILIITQHFGKVHLFFH